MQCIKTYEYRYSEEEINQMIVDYWNSKNDKHLPITKANVSLELNYKEHIGETIELVVTIKEGV